MINPVPNYKDLGYADRMGSRLRSLVEKQLINDLKFYGIEITDIRFDWSESCIEGHHTDFLDGTVENFSGISIFDNQNKLLAGGWMEFIHEQDFFLAYWEFITTYDNGRIIHEKKDVGIPEHVWIQIPDNYKPSLEIIRMQLPPNIP